MQRLISGLYMVSYKEHPRTLSADSASSQQVLPEDLPDLKRKYTHPVLRSCWLFLLVQLLLHNLWYSSCCTRCGYVRRSYPVSDNSLWHQWSLSLVQCSLLHHLLLRSYHYILQHLQDRSRLTLHLPAVRLWSLCEPELLHGLHESVLWVSLLSFPYRDLLILLKIWEARFTGFSGYRGTCQGLAQTQTLICRSRK